MICRADFSGPPVNELVVEEEEEMDPAVIYNLLQTVVYAVMAVLIMRLKLFLTPHLCILAGRQPIDCCELGADSITYNMEFDQMVIRSVNACPLLSFPRGINKSWYVMICHAPAHFLG